MNPPGHPIRSWLDPRIKVVSGSGGKLIRQSVRHELRRQAGFRSDPGQSDGQSFQNGSIAQTGPRAFSAQEVAY